MQFLSILLTAGSSAFILFLFFKNYLWAALKLCLEIKKLKSAQRVCKEEKKLYHVCARFHHWVAFCSFPTDVFIAPTDKMLIYDGEQMSQGSRCFVLQAEEEPFCPSLITVSATVV